MDAPFKLGDTYWRPSGHSDQVTIECPMCCGDKCVTVILGDGEKFNVDCEACGLGYAGPQGTITEYTRTPHAEPFVIHKIVSWRDGKWTVESTDGCTLDFDLLYATEAGAVAKAVERATALEDDNMARLRKKKYGRVSSWKIQYHQRQIADFQKQIAWHERHIDAKKAREVSDG